MDFQISALLTYFVFMEIIPPTGRRGFVLYSVRTMIRPGRGQ